MSVITVSAIRAYREKHGCSLQEAKKILEYDALGPVVQIRQIEWDGLMERICQLEDKLKEIKNDR